jgi:acetyl esterase
MPSLTRDFLVRARERAGGIAVDAFFRGLSRAGRVASRVRPEEWGIRVHSDIPYLGTGREAHRLDVWSAHEPGANAPVLFYVHGGGFRILSKDTHWNFALAFARLGYVVVTINYTLSGERPFPAAIEDVAAAWCWVLDNAERFGGDPTVIVAAGESAGGNLVTALTIMATMARPERWAKAVFTRGVVPAATMPACPLLQVSNPERFDVLAPETTAIARDRIFEVCRSYLNDPAALPRADAALADPVCILEGDADATRPLPPFFSLCGTRDVCVHDARRLAKALHARGVYCEHPEYAGEIHAFHALPLLRNARVAWREQRAFLVGVLGERAPKPLRRLTRRTGRRRG